MDGRLNVTMFTVTPHRAIHSRIPVINIDGQSFADLSWFEGGAHLLLILRRSPLHSVESHPLYTIGVRDAEGETANRIARVPLTSNNHGPRTWVSLYLSHLTQSVQHVPRIHMPMNHIYLYFIII